ncbi:hypothetical protein TNCV_757541 [Trichonephila clavipes]|nr:hypothetical protein TNCV_757541 [Trichonephila clavipes]
MLESYWRLLEWLLMRVLLVADAYLFPETGVRDDTTRRASGYESLCFILTALISFSSIHVGQDRENEEWSPLQFTHRSFALQSALSWPTSAHLEQVGWPRQTVFEYPNLWH